MNSQDFISTINTFLLEFGGHAVLIRVSAGVYDPVLSKVAQTEILYNTTAIMLDYIKKDEGVKDRENALIRSGDKQIFIRPILNGPYPEQGVDFIEMAGVRRKIVSVKELNPSGLEPIFFELYVRE